MGLRSVSVPVLQTMGLGIDGHNKGISLTSEAMLAPGGRCPWVCLDQVGLWPSRLEWWTESCLGPTWGNARQIKACCQCVLNCPGINNQRYCECYDKKCWNLQPFPWDISFMYCLMIVTKSAKLKEVCGTEQVPLWLAIILHLPQENETERVHNTLPHPSQL